MIQNIRPIGHLPVPRIVVFAAGLLALGACASAPREREPVVGVRLEPLPQTSPPPVSTTTASSQLPGLSIAQISEGTGTGRRMERFDAVDQDLPIVLQGLAESYGISLQIDPGVTGKVTAQLRNATLQEALAAVVLPSGYEFTIENGVLRVGGARNQTRMFTMDYVSISRSGTANTAIQRRIGTGGGGGGSDNITSSSVGDLWEELRLSLDALVFDISDALPSETASSTVAVISNSQQTVTTSAGTGGGARAYSRAVGGRKLIINPLAGTILVTAPPAKLAEIAIFISAIESSVQRQVLIEAKIVDVTLREESQFGIDWNVVMRIKNLKFGFSQALAPAAGGVALTLGNANTGEINAVLRALESQGDVKVLLSPRVSALNNQRAIFQATTEEVVFTVARQPILGPNGGTIGFNTAITPQQISVGLVLDVLAQISADNTITMNIRPHVTSVLRFESIKLDDGSEARAPVIDTRETDTMIRMRGGETIIIGGLMQTRLSKERSGVPGLSRIPGIGKVFTGTRESTEKAELVIFITSTIIASQPLVVR